MDRERRSGERDHGASEGGEAAVAGVFHPKWHERPLACVAPLVEFRDTITKQEVLEYLAARVAKW
jgi:fatty-acyl-CoA synthase